LGLPTEDDLKKMSEEMTDATIELIFKIDDIPKKEF
jgi:hypothetical protein